MAIVFCMTVLTSTLSVGQTCCTAWAPMSSTYSVSNNGAKSIILSLDYTYASVNRLVSNNEVLQNDPRSRFGQYLLLKGDFAISDRWSMSFILPYIYQSRTTFSLSESISALGDLILLGQYDLLLNKLSLAVGIQLPTGGSNGINASGLISSPDMQSGSGTYDYILNLNWNEYHFIVPNFQQNLSLSYKHNRTNNHFGDPAGQLGRKFKFGNELVANVNWGYLLFIDTWFIIPNIGIVYNYNTKNEEEGYAASNSGGHWINIPFEVQFQPGDKLIFGVDVSLPIYQKLDGLQITTNYSLGFLVSYILL